MTRDDGSEAAAAAPFLQARPEGVAPGEMDAEGWIHPRRARARVVPRRTLAPAELRWTRPGAGIDVADPEYRARRRAALAVFRSGQSARLHARTQRAWERVNTLAHTVDALRRRYAEAARAVVALRDDLRRTRRDARRARAASLPLDVGAMRLEANLRAELAVQRSAEADAGAAGVRAYDALDAARVALRSAAAAESSATSAFMAAWPAAFRPSFYAQPLDGPDAPWPLFLDDEEAAERPSGRENVAHSDAEEDEAEGEREDDTAGGGGPTGGGPHLAGGVEWEDTHGVLDAAHAAAAAASRAPSASLVLDAARLKDVAAAAAAASLSAVSPPGWEAIPGLASPALRAFRHGRTLLIVLKPSDGDDLVLGDIPASRQLGIAKTALARLLARFPSPPFAYYLSEASQRSAALRGAIVGAVPVFRGILDAHGTPIPEPPGGPPARGGGGGRRAARAPPTRGGALAAAESYCFTDGDIKKYVALASPAPKARATRLGVTTEPELGARLRSAGASIAGVGDGVGRCAMLLATNSPTDGHWEALLQWPPSGLGAAAPPGAGSGPPMIEFFDPYGRPPDADLDSWLPMSRRVALHEASNAVADGLAAAARQGWTTVANKTAFQTKSDTIDTCGRHVAVRLSRADLRLPAYTKWLAAQRAAGGDADYDATVTRLTGAIVGK